LPEANDASRATNNEEEMIDRYTRPRMSAIWDLQHKYEIWLEVELQACAAFERGGQIPRGTSARIRKKAKIDVARIAEIEKVTKHDVIAFLESLMDSVGPEHRFLHMGLTSSDIVDTSLAVQMTEALDLILEDLERVDCCAEETGTRASPYGDGRPVARHSWRAGVVRVQVGDLV
jgi:adenylosuccinate lyase